MRTKRGGGRVSYSVQIEENECVPCSLLHTSSNYNCDVLAKAEQRRKHPCDNPSCKGLEHLRKDPNYAEVKTEKPGQEKLVCTNLKPAIIVLATGKAVNQGPPITGDDVYVLVCGLHLQCGRYGDHGEGLR